MAIIERVCRYCGKTIRFDDNEHNYHVCVECRRSRSRAARIRAFTDYTIAAPSGFNDIDEVKRLVDALETIKTRIPDWRYRNIKDVCASLQSRLGELLVEFPEDGDWADMLADFEYSHFAYELIAIALHEGGIIDALADIEYFTKKGEHYRYVLPKAPTYDDFYDNRYELGDIYQREEGDFYFNKIEPYLETFRLIEEDIEMDGGRDKYKFKPSMALQGGLIRHFACGKKVRDPSHLRPLVTASLKTMIVKEFIEHLKTQDNGKFIYPQK